MAVLMHKYEDMDYKQIGDVLKLSRIRHQIAALPRLPDPARKAERFCLASNCSGEIYRRIDKQ